MYFKQLLNERCGCASYVVACNTKQAAIVDPGVVTEPYEALLEERGLELRFVIDTHVHADHVSGARALTKKYGAALCLYETAKVSYPFTPLHHGEELELGQLRLRIIHTPGHRPELISILIVNPSRSPEPSMVLTGDSLLVGDVGRPDFNGGDAAAQYESLSRLLRLPDWVAVFPGHFEGPCGKGMCGRPSTTIGFERLYNPLARMDRSQFIENVGSGIPPRPLNMSAIEPTNRGMLDMPWAMLNDNVKAREVDVEALASRPAEALVLDVREPDEYVRGHVPEAINLPQADLAVRLDELPRDRPLYILCHAGYRALRAAQFLVQMGYDQVVSVKGGTEAWRASGRDLASCEAESSEVRTIETDWGHAGAYNYEI